MIWLYVPFESNKLSERLCIHSKWPLGLYVVTSTHVSFVKRLSLYSSESGGINVLHKFHYVII